jgi:hypothetical protein
MAIGGSRTKVEFGCFTHMRGREGGSGEPVLHSSSFITLRSNLKEF